MKKIHTHSIEIMLLVSQVLIFFIPAKLPTTYKSHRPFIQSQGNQLFKLVILNRSNISPLIGSQFKALPYILFL